MSEDVSEQDYEDNSEHSDTSGSGHSHKKEKHEAELEPHIKAKLDRHMNELNMMDEVDYVPGFGPVRFRYTSVTPNNFGLTDEDLLMVPEKELDKIMATRHMVPYVKHDPEMNYSNFGTCADRVLSGAIQRASVKRSSKSTADLSEDILRKSRLGLPARTCSAKPRSQGLKPDWMHIFVSSKYSATLWWLSSCTF